ncbi:MAG: DUF4097 domain-containing protein [Gammaproteobacteria bacterium]|nr:DUF4097 domain-containing protein [Gammaproteobacteria bacterium]
MRTYLLFTAALLFAAPLGAQQERQKIDTTFAFEKGGVVNLGHVSGDIVVTGWNKLEAKVYAVIETGYLEATLTSSRIQINAKSRRNRMGESRYELSVPIGTEVRVSTVSGDIAVRGTAGEVTVNAVSGNIEVRDATRAEIGTVSGDVRAEKLGGLVRLRTVSGDATLDNLVGELRGKSVSGTLRVRGALSGLDYETMSGDIEFRGDIKPNGIYNASTHSGDVRLTLPENVAADLDLKTFSGEMRTEFPLTLRPGAEAVRRGREMRTTINGGGARISLGTFSGDITIQKGAARPTKED